MSEEEPKGTKGRSPAKFLITAIFFLIVGGVLAGAAVYNIARKYPDVLGIATVTTQEEEAKNLLSAVGKIMDIPTDEVPTITIAMDTEPIEDSTFKNAKNGDRIITFAKSRRVILFRPSENKIIDVGFIGDVSNSAQTPTPTPVPAKMRVFIFNGTSLVGATKNLESKLDEKNQEIDIVGRITAAKTDYADTIVIDLSGNRAEDAKKIADYLGVSVAPLPEGEKAPENADFLIIVGKGTASPSPTPTVAPAPGG